MLRNKAFTALQKTYDESYLSCSTAVYYESQSDESEAMRHWKHALEQIYEHRVTRATPGYEPQTGTEKALVEAVKQLELQCKERIDLLEALRVSRNERRKQRAPSNIVKDATYDANSHDERPKGSIGQGTVPAVTYSELSRPSVPPRPSLPIRASSAQKDSYSCGDYDKLDISPTANLNSRSQSPNQPTRTDKTLRSTSPEKYTMRTTLRTSKYNEKPNRPIRKSPKPAEGPSKAATLAWSGLGSPDRSSGVSVSNGCTTASQAALRQAKEHMRPAPSPIWDSHSRRLVSSRETDIFLGESQFTISTRHSDDGYSKYKPPHPSVSAASSALNSSNSRDISLLDQSTSILEREYPVLDKTKLRSAVRTTRVDGLHNPSLADCSGHLSERKKHKDGLTKRRGIATRPLESQSLSKISTAENKDDIAHGTGQSLSRFEADMSESEGNAAHAGANFLLKQPISHRSKSKAKTKSQSQSSDDGSIEDNSIDLLWKCTKASTLKNLPPGVDEGAAKQILNDIIVQGDEVHWSDIAGLEIAKNALRETVVYPFLRPDLFMGLREPARGMLLFGPPGTGKTMLARAVATESKSTFFSISASSLTSKYLGESEKLVRALFGLARLLAPSIIFVDEIDSLLSQRSGSGEHETTRRIKTEFLIQWSDLQRAAAGREASERDKERGDANRVLVLAATNLPWAIDEAARRRFVRRQYIPLPEPHTREIQLRTLLGQQKHDLSGDDIDILVKLTDGFSGSDITALAKDAAMGPLRSLGEALLHMTMDDIRPIQLSDFEASLGTIRPSVGKAGLKEYENWAKEFGERGG